MLERMKDIESKLISTRLFAIDKGATHVVELLTNFIGAIMSIRVALHSVEFSSEFSSVHVAGHVEVDKRTRVSFAFTCYATSHQLATL